MEYLSLSQAAKLVPTSSGKRPSVMTVYRWITVGTHGVKLQHARFGKRIATTEEWLAEFGAKVAEAWAAENAPAGARAATPPVKPKARTAAQREKAIAAAEARLKARGCMSE